tara:strand:- start:21500 stop:21655 length:156 start_codon:yes stop_codon:yes gene_type:complete
VLIDGKASCNTCRLTERADDCRGDLRVVGVANHARRLLSGTSVPSEEEGQG